MEQSQQLLFRRQLCRLGASRINGIAQPAENKAALLTTILADGINLGLSRMAEACRGATLRQLAWVHDWHIREETYAAALSRLIKAHRTIPLAQLWVWGPHPPPMASTSELVP